MTQIAYISAPYRGKDEIEVKQNVALAEEIGRYVEGLTGMHPVVVHTMILAQWGPNSYPPDSKEDLEIIDMNLKWLKRSSVMYICGDRISFGMKQEIDFCEKNGIPVVYLDNKWIRRIRILVTCLQPSI